MAKINVIGDTIQIKTSITNAEYELVEHYYPNALKCLDKDGNEYFGINKGDAHVSKYGISFCNTDAEDKLFMTARNPVEDHTDPEEEKKIINRKFALIIKNLQIIETQIATIKPEIEALEENANNAIDMQ